MTGLPLDRVLIVAPHPDDDVISAGGIIQRAIAAGGEIRVLFLTNGESNPWPQRAQLRKWRITAADREAWAVLRAKEAVAGLQLLGAPGDCAHFLRFPDQQLSSIARNGDESVRAAIANHARDFQPSLAIVPSVFDFHSDHRAAAYFCHRVIEPQLITTYVVHGRVPPQRTRFTIQLGEGEQRKKRDAIGEHATQLLLSRERFLAYARATEHFYIQESDVMRVESAAHERIDKLRHAAYAIVNAARYRARR
ncbi:MAG TPA: PIG-L family deacetylase [Thermoanaerobaculia bacterium]|jgi:LmbE family N-acetylglucosaminyl deacetylase|nr:PIG-L family deacetylase [Thermoanaerobaculia bacterium]